MSTNADEIDYDTMMRANLTRVFGERDAERRIVAIAELYSEDAVLYEPQGLAEGHTAINKAVRELHNSLPPDFTFAPLGPAVGHHGLGRLRWSSGPSGQPHVVTGMDVAQFEQGLISSLFVFIDPPGV